MYEELYIIDNGKRLRVDLSIPSGITLNFKSNIFGDLSKITCSYTYTFKLPLTANNRRVFDNADDIRCVSNKIRRRLKAEYIQNGIPLFKNANLYIESTENNFNAVMTWGVIDGLQALKDDDKSIQELPLIANPIFGPCNAKIDEYTNEADFVQPLYNAGVTYITGNGFKDITGTTYSCFPPPVIPIFRLIQLINNYYGTKFNFGSKYQYGDSNQNHRIINLGVIPCISIDGVDGNANAEPTVTTNLGTSLRGPFGFVEYILSGASDKSSSRDDRIQYVKDTEGYTIALKNMSNDGITLELDGCLQCKFKCDGNGFFHDQWVEPGFSVFLTEPPRLSIYYIDENSHQEQIAYIDAEFSYDNSWCWVFNFSQRNGKNRIEVKLPPKYTIFFGIYIGIPAKTITMPFSKIIEPIALYEKIDIKNIKWNQPEAKAGSIKINLMRNLPDISCLTLIKSLFFMLGAYPTINQAGEIIPIYYSTIRENLLNGITMDWSKKTPEEYNGSTTKIKYNVTGFGQKNLYLMKNDENNSDDNQTDIYASGKGVIHVDNETIEPNKTIIQLPFYAPYLENKRFPYNHTGHTMKFWYFEDNEILAKDALPCVGMIKPFPQTLDGADTGIVWMGMEVWNDFAKINNDPSYSYLAKIMQNPIIITESLMLNELDLRDLDYSVPVYLSKYGAYFAIVSISRDSKGICKCELLKLPEEE